jgi:hypothetical protein
VCPRAGLDMVVKDPHLYQESKSGRPSSSLVTKLTELSRLLQSKYILREVVLIRRLGYTESRFSSGGVL